MKRYIFVFVVLSFMSCGSDDNEAPTENLEYLEQLSGLYRITDAYFNRPLDLNGDGVKSLNLSDEIVYANLSVILETYEGIFYVYETIQSFNFTIPYSKFDPISQNYTNEIQTLQARCRIDVDSRNESFEVLSSEYDEEFIYEQFKAKILDLTWEDRKAVLKLETELFTPEGVWETVILTMEYEWEHDSI